MNRATLLLLFGMIAFAGWGSWEHLERRKTEAQLATLQAERESPAGRKPVVVAQTEPQKGSAQPAEEKNPPSEEAGAEKANKEENSAQNAMAEGVAKAMKDPAMREAMKAQARMGISMVYRDLFDLLNLQEPKRSQFEALINEKATVGMELGFELMAGGKTPEERQKLIDEITSRTKDADKKIRELLTPEEFSQMERYEKSTPERMQLDSLRGMLAGTDAPLDEATEGKLMDMMYQEREKAAFVSDFASQQNMDMTRFTPDNMKRFSEDSAALNEQISKRAAGILKAEQMEIFRKSQEQQAAMMKMQMDMAAKIFAEQ